MEKLSQLIHVRRVVTWSVLPQRSVLTMRQVSAASVWRPSLVMDVTALIQVNIISLRLMISISWKHCFFPAFETFLWAKFTNLMNVIMF